MPDLGFAAFIQEAPIIEIKGGVAIIRYRGDPQGDRAMSVRTLARALERGQRALQRHAAGEENVIVDE
jgi:NaMN:DMB phosphoribosyltransferase